jgi:hypothetical protein
VKSSSPSLLVLVLMSAATVPACGGGVSVSQEGSVDTGGGAVAVAFADTSGAGVPVALEPDVVVASRTRGEVDVLVRQDFFSWRVYGNFFSGGQTVQVAGGRVSGAGAVFVRTDDGEVALMPTEAGTSHRLGFPVSIYHFIRNGQATDTSPPAAGFAVGDLDGDGSVEAAVAAPGLGVIVLPGLAAAADPKVSAEHPPTINGFKLAAGASPSDVVITDVDGDGAPDVAAIDAKDGTLRTWRTQTRAPLNIQPDKTLALPGPAAALHATGCASAPLIVTLADGTMVAMGRSGKLDKVLPEMAPVHHVAASGDALAVDSAHTPGLSLFDACAGGGGSLLGLPVAVQSVAMTAANAASAREIAVLQPDGNTVSMFQTRNSH